MRKTVAIILLLACLPLCGAFIIFPANSGGDSGGQAGDALHAWNIDNGTGTNVNLNGVFHGTIPDELVLNGFGNTYLDGLWIADNFGSYNPGYRNDDAIADGISHGVYLSRINAFGVGGTWQIEDDGFPVYQAGIGSAVRNDWHLVGNDTPGTYISAAASSVPASTITGTISTNNLPMAQLGGGGGPKVYRALIFMSDTVTITETNVLENSLGGNPVWTSDFEVLTATLPGAFPTNKVFPQVTIFGKSIIGENGEAGGFVFTSSAPDHVIFTFRSGFEFGSSFIVAVSLFVYP